MHIKQSTVTEMMKVDDDGSLIQGGVLTDNYIITDPQVQVISCSDFQTFFNLSTQHNSSLTYMFPEDFDEIKSSVLVSCDCC